MLEVLQDSELVGDLVALHQLLVHELSGHCSFGALLIAFLNDRESAPRRQVEKTIFRGLCGCHGEKALLTQAASPAVGPALPGISGGAAATRRPQGSLPVPVLSPPLPSQRRAPSGRGQPRDVLPPLNGAAVTS